MARGRGGEIEGRGWSCRYRRCHCGGRSQIAFFFPLVLVTFAKWKITNLNLLSIWVISFHEEGNAAEDDAKFVKLIASGKHLHNYGKSPFLMGKCKSTINGRWLEELQEAPRSKAMGLSLGEYSNLDSKPRCHSWRWSQSRSKALQLPCLLVSGPTEINRSMKNIITYPLSPDISRFIHILFHIFSRVQQHSCIFRSKNVYRAQVVRCVEFRRHIESGNPFTSWFKRIATRKNVTSGYD